MSRLRKVLALMMILTVFSIGLTGCKSDHEHPHGEHPSTEHPTSEHPTSEHPG